jgi:hypothetical protein
VRQSESTEDSFVAAVQATHEPMQMRQVVSLHRLHPGIEAFTTPTGQDLGERADVTRGGIQGRAGGANPLQLELLLVVACTV